MSLTRYKINSFAIIMCAYSNAEYRDGHLYTPGFDDRTKISIGLCRLGQRFGRPGRCGNEPEVQETRHGPKMSVNSKLHGKPFRMR